MNTFKLLFSKTTVHHSVVIVMVVTYICNDQMKMGYALGYIETVRKRNERAVSIFFFIITLCTQNLKNNRIWLPPTTPIL